MTDRWAGCRNRGHNLSSSFFFFYTSKGVQANPFLFLFQGFVCKKNSEITSLSRHSSYSIVVLFLFPRKSLQLYCNTKITSIAFECLSTIIRHLDPGGRQKRPVNLKGFFLFGERLVEMERVWLSIPLRQLHMTVTHTHAHWLVN